MARVTKDTTISEVLTMDNSTAAILMQFGMHCVGCPASSGETMEQAAAAHGIDLDDLIKALNDHLNGKAE